MVEMYTNHLNTFPTRIISSRTQGKLAFMQTYLKVQSSKAQVFFSSEIFRGIASVQLMRTMGNLLR